MQSSLENFISMSSATSAKCHANQLIVDSSVTFKASLTFIDNNLKAVYSWEQVRNESTSGYTILKKENRIAAADIAIAISQAMVGYAYDSKSSDLMQNALVKRTELLLGRDTKCLDKLKYIHSLAVANAAAIIPYGIDAAKIASLDDKVKDYEASIPLPRTHLNKLKNATAQVKKLCKEMSKAFNFSLDPGMEQFRLSNPDFYNEYFNARMIIDLKGPSTGLKGTVTDSISKIRLKKVKISIVEAGTNRLTSLNGNYSFKKLTPGFYTINVKLAGYNELTLTNIEVKAGVLLDLDIKLQKAAQQNLAA